MHRRILRPSAAAACLVLALGTGSPAIAAPPDEPRPAVQSPRGPTDTPARDDGPQAPLNDAPPPAPTTESPLAAEATAPSPPTALVATAPAPRAVPSDGLSLRGHSLWDGLLQRRMSLTLHDGSAVTGVLISQSDRQLGVARDPEGRLVSVDKDAIARVEVEARRQLPAFGDGTGLLAGGGLLLGLGIPTAIAGLTFTFFAPDIGLFFLPGPIAVGAGIPMVVVGNRRKRAHTEALRRARLGHITPQLQVSPRGGSAGIRWRF